MIVLKNESAELVLCPELGGSILRFDFQGRPVFRAAPDSTTAILDAASFPLVPFSGRIAGGQFQDAQRRISLPPNFPGRPVDPNTLHGQGWLLPWQVDHASDMSAALSLHHPPGDWPWDYRAKQSFELHATGFTQQLRLTNLDARAMPAGLGVHPFFPRNAQTLLVAQHRGEWQTTADGIPSQEVSEDRPVDWWNGAPVETRLVDTAYSGRSGDLSIVWPDRDMALSIRPSDTLPHTVIYVPPGKSFFCVEPVSHIPNAHNAGSPHEQGLVELKSGEIFEATIDFSVETVAAWQARRRGLGLRPIAHLKETQGTAHDIHPRHRPSAAFAHQEERRA